MSKKRITWKIEKRKLADLKPHPKNPRQFTEKGMKDLENSINSIGFMQPININQDGTILSGHARTLKLQQMGEVEVDVYVPDRLLTPKQEDEVLVRANANTAGQWDFDILANEFEDFELTEWGLEIPAIETEELEAKEDDFDGEPPAEPITVLGDLYEIGEHRLLCGDSTCSDVVAKLMNGELADIAHNDPPYGMKKEKDGVLNDNLNFDDLLQFNQDWISLQFAVLKDNGSWYCWGIDELLMDIYSEILKPYIKTQKATFRNLITWDKGHGQGQNSENTRSYAIADEKCLFIMMGVQGFNNNADNYFEGWEPIRLYLLEQRKLSGLTAKEITNLTNTAFEGHSFQKSQWAMPTEEGYNKIKNYCKNKNNDAFKKEYDELKKEYDELKKEYYSTRAYFNNIHDNFNNVWHFERTSNKEREGTGEHATPKPIELCERAIKSSCPENGLVLDFFLGSGSTMVASHQLKRKCYGMELDPKYTDVIIKRMIKLDPSLKITRNGEDCKQEFIEKND
jgi:DNA modification methylase